MTVPPRTTTWSNLAGKPEIYTKSEIDALLAIDLTNYYTKQEVDTLVGTAPDLSDYYTRAETDGLLLDKAAANHNHNHLYVTPSTLTTQLSDKVDYNSLGLLLNGYEQIDSSILRYVSGDSDWHTLRYYSGGSNVDFKVPTESKINQIEIALTMSGLFSGF